MDLKEIQKPAEILLEQTNQILKKNIYSNINLIQKINKFTPFSQGKKIRSTLLFLLAGMNNSITDNFPSIAATIEMLHLSSLIHDDIVDNSDLRRGQKTVNANFGNNISVLWGDFLFIYALNVINNLENKELLMNTLLEAAKLMIEGQLKEVENNFNYNINQETYYDIVKKKTAALFAAVAELTSNIKGDTAEKINKFYRFGLDFGVMFQIKDDMLDISSNNSGKDRFRDLNEGKMTLPYILLLQRNRSALIDSFSKGNKEAVLLLFKKYKIKESLSEKIESQAKLCEGFLREFPDSIYRESLLKLIKFVKHRDY